MMAIAMITVAPQSASAQIFQFNVGIDGTQSGTGSTGTGMATALLDSDSGALSISGSFSGLSGDITVAHLHGLTAAPGAGNAGILVPLTPTGTSSGTFSGNGTLSSENVTGLLDGRTYINLHSTTFGGGEIRGFVPAAVPEPASATLVAFAGLGLAMIRRRK